MIEYYGESGDWSPLPTASSYVWTNGCYDILHVGHLRLLEECRIAMQRLPNSMLIVGIDSDKRVKELKGDFRPINNQHHRAEMLLSIKGVGGVFIYDNANELEEILLSVKPDIMIIGEEYKNREIIGGAHCKSIQFFPKVDSLSTSGVIQKCKINT